MIPKSDNYGYPMRMVITIDCRKSLTTLKELTEGSEEAYELFKYFLTLNKDNVDILTFEIPIQCMELIFNSLCEENDIDESGLLYALQVLQDSDYIEYS